LPAFLCSLLPVFLPLAEDFDISAQHIVRAAKRGSLPRGPLAPDKEARAKACPKKKN